MGVAVSSWKLANTVSRRGQLGVVSGTGIGIVMVSRLMYGDEGGHVRRALAHFPLQDVAQRLIKKYYREGGLPEGHGKTRPCSRVATSLVDVPVAASRGEDSLAKLLIQVLDKALFSILFHFNHVGVAVNDWLHKHRRDVSHLHFDGIDDRVEGGKCVWSESCTS